MAASVRQALARANSALRRCERGLQKWVTALEELEIEARAEVYYAGIGRAEADNARARMPALRHALQNARTAAEVAKVQQAIKWAETQIFSGANKDPIATERHFKKQLEHARREVSDHKGACVMLRRDVQNLERLAAELGAPKPRKLSKRKLHGSRDLTDIEERQYRRGLRQERAVGNVRERWRKRADR